MFHYKFQLLGLPIFNVWPSNISLLVQLFGLPMFHYKFSCLAFQCFIFSLVVWPFNVSLVKLFGLPMFLSLDLQCFIISFSCLVFQCFIFSSVIWPSNVSLLVKLFGHPMFLAHLSRRLKWAFLIKICLLSVIIVVVVLVVVVVVNFSHLHLLLQNHWASFNQTWHKASLCEGDLFKWRAPPFSKGW